MKNLLKIGFTGIMICFLAMPVSASGDSVFIDGQNPVGFDIFPNPVTESSFTISSDVEITEVHIINLLGQEIFAQNYVAETKINIELEIKEKGVYLLQVKTFDGSVTTKRILFK
jgi:hypothetical protein